MRYPKPVLAASLVGLVLLVGAPARAQVAETVRASMSETGGRGPVARRTSSPVFAVFALPVAAGIEASDHQFHKVRGGLLNPNASVFTVEKPPGTVAGETLARPVPYREHDGVVRLEGGVDEAGLLEGAAHRDARSFWAH